MDPLRYLRDHRRRLVQSHDLARAFATYLTTMAELLDAVGRELADERWHSVASILDGAAIRLREL